MRKFLEAVNTDSPGIMYRTTSPGLTLAKILEIYIDKIVNGPSAHFAAKFPELDDDTLSDCISEYLRKEGIELTRDETNTIYYNVKDHFKIFG